MPTDPPAMTPYEKAIAEVEEAINSPEVIARRLELNSQPSSSTFTFCEDGTVIVESINSNTIKHHPSPVLKGKTP